MGLRLGTLMAMLHGVAGYTIVGVLVVLIVSIVLQLRAARQFKRAMHEVGEILDLVEEIYTVSSPKDTTGGQAALAPISSELGPEPLSQPAPELSALEQAILEAVTDRYEIQESELVKHLAEKGFRGVLIKAVIADIIRKTAADDMPRLEVRHTQGRYSYRLRPGAGAVRLDVPLER